MFFCEFREIFQNTFFIEQILWLLLKNPLPYFATLSIVGDCEDKRYNLSLLQFRIKHAFEGLVIKNGNKQLKQATYLHWNQVLSFDIKWKLLSQKNVIYYPELINYLSFVLFMNSKFVINSKNIKTRSPITTAFAFCVVMNMRHLGSKESLGVKYKGDICTELCLKLWFESSCYFCNEWLVF